MNRNVLLLAPVLSLAMSADLQAEDKVIGARKLGIRLEAVRITPVDEVFKSAPRQ